MACETGVTDSEAYCVAQPGLRIPPGPSALATTCHHLPPLATISTELFGQIPSPVHQLGPSTTFWHQHCSRWPQEGFMMASSGLNLAQRRPPGPAISAKNNQKTKGKPTFLKNRVLSTVLALRRPSWPQRCSTGALNGPKMASKWPQDGLKMAPRRS